ncbi:hypothetical protein Tco_1548807 [Tanacetum coccineum]
MALTLQRSQNKKADALSKIASTSFAHLSKQVLVEELNEKSINEKEVLDILEEEGHTWMTPICEYLTKEILPKDKKKARVVRRKASSLNQSDQDSLNFVANGNFLTKNTQEALTIIENKSKVQTSRNKTQVSSASGSSAQDAHVTALTKQVEPHLSSMNRPVNSLQNDCQTCVGPHAYYECQAAGGYTQEDVYATMGTYNQSGNSYQPQGALLSNTEPNPREQVNSITTSGLTTAKPSIPPHVPPTLRVEVEKEPETLMDGVHITKPYAPSSTHMSHLQNSS